MTIKEIEQERRLEDAKKEMRTVWVEKTIAKTIDHDSGAVKKFVILVKKEF